jgi:hypothetical protein
MACFEDDPDWQRAHVRYLEDGACNADGRRCIRREAADELYEIESRYESAADAAP